MSRVHRSEGFTLPLALLAVLGLTALALAAFTLVLSELGDGRMEALVLSDLASAGQPGGGAATWSPGTGYRVEVVPAGHGARVRVRLLWSLDARAEALAWGEPARLGRQVVGPLGVDDLLARWGHEDGVPVAPADPVPPGGGLSGEATGPAGGLRVWGDGVVWVPPVEAAGGAGGGVGVLVAPGDLRIEGDGVLRGLVAVGGRLELPAEGGVELRGGVVAGQHAVGMGGSAVVSDPPALEAALQAAVPPEPVLVPGGAHLGWFVP